MRVGMALCPRPKSETYRNFDGIYGINGISTAAAASSWESPPLRPKNDKIGA